MTDVVALPVGTRLLHVGPQKTGTTTLQGAFHAGRSGLSAQGVHYAGRQRQPRAAAAAVVHGRVLPGYPADSLERWPELVTEVRASTARRVVVSAEMFADADPAAVHRVVEGIGPGDVHVVLTLRPLSLLAPSQWQQLVQAGLRTDYESWLREVLASMPTSARAQRFWHRHRHDLLARRWADEVGVDHVTVVAPAVDDRTGILRAFESLLDLTPGTLVPEGSGNRSFTVPEIELVREVNRQFAEQDWPQVAYDRGIRFGMDYWLRGRTPGPDEPPITTPAWAAEVLGERAQTVVDGIRALGVRVVGDLDHLLVPVAAPAPAGRSGSVTNATAARAVLGVLRATEVAPTRLGGQVSRDADAGGTEEPAPSTRALIGLLRRRVTARAARPASRLLRRLRGAA